jgi:hypothetical protein
VGASRSPHYQREPSFNEAGAAPEPTGCRRKLFDGGQTSKLTASKSHASRESFRLIKRFSDTPCSAASMASSRCCSGGMRTSILPLKR